MEVARPFCEPDSMTVFAMLITVDFSNQTFKNFKNRQFK